MKQIPMICNDVDCVCEDLCCQECNKTEKCTEICDSYKFRQQVYADRNFLADQLQELAERLDSWMILVAAQHIREIKPAEEYLKKCSSICDQFEEEGCKDCPIRDFSCGSPKRETEIKQVIQVVFSDDFLPSPACCHHCMKKLDSELLEVYKITHCPYCGKSIEEAANDEKK